MTLRCLLSGSIRWTVDGLLGLALLLLLTLMLLWLQHAAKSRSEASRLLDVLFGSPPHPQPLVRAQRTMAIFLMKELQNQLQQQHEIRQLLSERGFVILWERQLRLSRETVELLCQVRRRHLPVRLLLMVLDVCCSCTHHPICTLVAVPTSGVARSA